MTNITDADREAARYFWGPLANDSEFRFLAAHRELGAREAIAEVVEWLRKTSNEACLDCICYSWAADIFERGEHTRHAALSDLIAGDADLIESGEHRSGSE